MARGTVDRRVIAVAVAIPLVIVVVVVLAGLGGGGGSDEAELTTTVATDPPDSTWPVAVDQAWNDALEEAVRPLGEAIPDLAKAVASWGSGDLDDAGFRTELDRLRPQFERVARATQDLPAHPDDELAAPLVRSMGRLYVLAVDAHELALSATDGAVATQYDRLGRRLRVLGDRMFDRARERTAEPFDPGDAVDLRLPAEVPDWPRLGLGVGPPLEPADTNVDELPLERADHRDSQPESSWRTAVDDLGAPTVGAVAGALDARSAGPLGELARRLVEATEALRAVPVPDGDRGRADRLGLAWLLRADAARAGQLAVLGDGGDDAWTLARSVLDVAGADGLASG